MIWCNYDSFPQGRIEIPPFTYFDILNRAHFPVTEEFLIILSHCVRHSLLSSFIGHSWNETGIICFDIERWRGNPGRYPHEFHRSASLTQLFAGPSNSNKCVRNKIRGPARAWNAGLILVQQQVWFNSVEVIPQIKTKWQQPVGI